MSVQFNFVLFSVYLSYIATQALLRSGYAIDSQKSIMILLIMVGALAWIGKWLSDLTDKVENQELNEGVTLSTFIWTGLAVGLIFAPSEKLSALAFIPLIAIFAAVYRPLFFKARGYTPFLAGMSALTQVASLAYILRIGGDFSAAFGVAFILWLAAVSIAQKYLAREDDGGWGAVLCYGQAIPVFWFFLNISNQTISYSQRASSVFMALAVLGFVVAAWRGRRASAAELPAGWIIWAPAMLFGLSLLVNFNIVHVLSIPFSFLASGGSAAHFWAHIVPGLDPIYMASKPFEDYLPLEGVIFGVYIPRLLFEYLDFSVNSYLVYTHLSGRISFLLFILVTVIALREGLGISRETGFLLAALACVTNLVPLQLYAGATWIYCWQSLERFQMLFVCFLLFRALLARCREMEEGSLQAAWRLYAAAAVTGAGHALCILHDITFGAPATLGLLAALAFGPFSPGVIMTALLGGVGLGLAYAMALDISLAKFFYHYPAGMVALGKSAVDISDPSLVTECFEYKKIFQIFDAITRDRVMLTFHHTVLVAFLAAFLAVLPRGVGKRRTFPLALYLAVITFALYISRGQKYQGHNLGPYTLVAHLNMAWALFPAALAYTMGLYGPAPGGADAPARRGAFALIAAVITLSSFDGFHLGAGGMPGWIPYELLKSRILARQSIVSRGMDGAMNHAYTALSRRAVEEGPKPDPEYGKPYSKIRDSLFDFIYMEQLSSSAPYRTKLAEPYLDCAICVPGPEFTGIDTPFVYGDSALFGWKGDGGEEYSLNVNSAEKRYTSYFRAVTSSASLRVGGLPADYSEILADLRIWRKDRTIARTTRRLTSMPGSARDAKNPIVVGTLDAAGPRLISPGGFIVPGKSVLLKWTAVKTSGYDVAAGEHVDRGELAWKYFHGHTTETSIAVSGLPADCRAVYIHLEAKAGPGESLGADVRAGGKWYRNSYIIYSAPEDYWRNPGGCGLKK